MKEGPITLGRNVLDSSASFSDRGNEEIIDGGRPLSGFMPRNAPKSMPEAGMEDSIDINCGGALREDSFSAMAPGRSCENMVMAMEKNMAILIVEDMLFIVILIPFADALSLEETAFIMAVVFGDANSPPPTPLRNIMSSNSRRLKL